MRFVLSLIGLLAFAFPQHAAADGMARGVKTSLAFVADTYITSSRGASFALCHRYEMRTLLGLGYGLTSHGYVLSEAQCQGQAYVENPVIVGAAFASGAVRGTPREPEFTLQEQLFGHAWFVICGVLVAALLLRIAGARFFGRSQMAERMEVLGLSDTPVFRFIDAMLHAANADGKAQQQEIDFIRDKATEIAQLEYSAEHIEWAIEHTDQLKGVRDFQRFGRGLTPPQARVVLRAALALVAADGEMSQSEQRFISQLTKGLMLDPAEVTRILEEDDADMGDTLLA
ncbi:MAG: DUF533 domain-containing protein [Pseudomonadota bacterium]